MKMKSLVGRLALLIAVLALMQNSAMAQAAMPAELTEAFDVGDLVVTAGKAFCIGVALFFVGKRLFQRFAK